MGDECNFAEPRGGKNPVPVGNREPIFGQCCDRLGVSQAMMLHLKKCGWQLWLGPWQPFSERDLEARYYGVGVGFLTCKRIQNPDRPTPEMIYVGNGKDQFFHDCGTFMTELPFATGGVVDGPRDILFGAEGPEERVFPRGACLGIPPAEDALKHNVTIKIDASKAIGQLREAADEVQARVEKVAGSKPTNPKDAIGSMKTPLMSVIPQGVIKEICLGLLEGALKYGRHNYRIYGVRASVYMDATMRHLSGWWEGEDIDPVSKLNHITKALSSLTVLRDAMLQDMWTDDRPPKHKGDWIGHGNDHAEKLIKEYKGEPVPPYTEKKK